MNATAGPVPEIPVLATQAVGSFGSTTTLSYTPSEAAAVASILLSFRAVMAIEAGESIILTLPGFSGPNSTDPSLPEWILFPEGSVAFPSVHTRSPQPLTLNQASQHIHRSPRDR